MPGKDETGQPQGDSHVLFLQEEMAAALRDMLSERLVKIEDRLEKFEGRVQAVEASVQAGKGGAATAEGGGSDGATIDKLREELNDAISDVKMYSGVGSPVNGNHAAAANGDGANGAGSMSSAEFVAGADGAGQHGTTDIGLGSFKFRMSCWDAVAFLGDTTIQEPLEMLSNLVLCFLNISIQTCFAIIVLMSLISSQLDDNAIKGFHMWRTNTGHTVQFMNDLTLESMASRVCRGDTSLYASDTQVNAVSDINAYLIDNAPFNGPLMAILAIYVWILTVSQEFHVLDDMVYAVFALPRAATSVSDDPLTARLQLKAISMARVSWICFLVFCRVMIAGVILFAGVKFLAVTISIEDILLNAIALEFVLNVDELVYHAMAPMKTRKFIMLLKPLPLPKHWVVSGMDLNLILTFFLTTGACVLVLVLFLIPEMDKMQEAKDELCAGKLDFVYSLSGLGAPYFSYGSGGFTEKEELLYSMQRYKVLRSVIEEKNITLPWMPANISAEPGYQHTLSRLVGPAWTVKGVAGMSIKRLAYGMNTNCVDSWDWGNEAFLMLSPYTSALLDTLLIYGLTNGSEYKSCKDLAVFCQDYYDPGPVTRAMCP